MQKAKENFIVYNVGAVGYGLLEVLWRGYTHWTMVATGGICFLLIYKTNEKLLQKNLILKCLVGALLVTAIELTVGILVNIVFKWHVWDYSDQPFNLYGQICALYSTLWFLLCIPLTMLCKFIRHTYFGNNEKTYANK